MERSRSEANFELITHYFMSQPQVHFQSTMTNIPLRHKIGAIVTPGDRLGLAITRNKTTLMAGNGTYIRQGHVYSSILGTLCATKHQDGEVEDDSGEKWIISVQSER